MLSLGADEVAAFPGGKGTHDMVTIAEAAEIPVNRVGWGSLF
jgi:hypothetical protein